MPFSDFTAGDVFTAASADTLMRQGIMVFASTAARDTALTGNLAEGMFAYVSDTDSVHHYDGATWKRFLDPITVTGGALTQGVSVASVITGAARVVGGVCTFSVTVNPSGTGTSGDPIEVNLSFLPAIQASSSVVGTFIFYDDGSPNLAGAVFAQTHATPSVRFMRDESNGLLGVSPAFAVAAADLLILSGSYIIA